MRSDQVATVPVTVEQVMRDPAFALGAADVRAGLPFRRQYDRWDTNAQWNYERGPCLGAGGRDTSIRGRDGKLSSAAVCWFRWGMIL